MNLNKLILAAAVGVLCWMMTATSFAGAVLERESSSAVSSIDNASCLKCHSGAKEIKVTGANGELRDMQPVKKLAFGKSVHSTMQCVACHQGIKEGSQSHKNGEAKTVGCVQCHLNLWEVAKKDGSTQEKPRLGTVVESAEAYKQTFHARPSKDDPTRVNASCDDCHDTHSFNVPPLGSPGRGAWHLTIPNTCGEKCHTEALEEYNSSIHGKKVTEEHDPKAAVCTDCHTSHGIINTSKLSFKLDIVHACGDCHKDKLRSYLDTFHGQVNTLGYGYTAKCYNCHGSHGILPASDPESKVHINNRLKTCQECHNGKQGWNGLQKATQGFVSFGPHANTHDFKKYPQMWIASTIMITLLSTVFAFFWIHSALWYYREYKDGCRVFYNPNGYTERHLQVNELLKNEAQDKQLHRFSKLSRLTHLLFGLITMTLILTGMLVLYADAEWSHPVAEALGGAKNAGIIHRVAAVGFLGTAIGLVIYMLNKLVFRPKKKFQWFGPDSLLPNWNDLRDIIAMFRWFLGKGERPIFDRWTYWEKFDFWSVLWGACVVGTSGMMLAFPHVTAAILPGWVFNVATLVHGYEALLAAVFLFTVHFFNNHFRPDKFPPPDVVMFTGSVPLHEFKRDRTAQYNRLVESGELEKYLVDPPSGRMTKGSKILGLTLIAIGLTLLVLVFIGFIGSVTGD